MIELSARVGHAFVLSNILSIFCLCGMLITMFLVVLSITIPTIWIAILLLSLTVFIYVLLINLLKKYTSPKIDNYLSKKYNSKRAEIINKNSDIISDKGYEGYSAKDSENI